MIRRPPRSTQSRSSAASDVYKRQRIDIADLDILQHQKFLDAEAARRILRPRTAGRTDDRSASGDLRLRRRKTPDVDKPGQSSADLRARVLMNMWMVPEQTFG